MQTIDLDIPRTAEEREAALIASWDKWYATLPDDLRRKLSLNDFKRLGQAFKGAFGIIVELRGDEKWIALSASERACYECPEESDAEKRAAFIAGALWAARSDTGSFDGSSQ